MNVTALNHARRKHYCWRLGAYLDDPELVRRFKQRALDEEMGYTALLVKMMRAYLAQGVPAEETLKDPRMF